MPLVLAIETSQRIGGVALRDHAGGVHVEMLSPKKRHDDDLMPAIDRVFHRAGLKPSDLDREGAVAVSIGPGGFTGLRIAVTTAKMLAETLATQLIAVPSALVAAESTLAADHPARAALIALASKGASCWCTRVERENSSWHIVGKPGVCDADSIDLANVDVLLADEFLPPSIRAKSGDARIAIIEPMFDPRACLAMAARMLQRGEVTDPLRLSPLYPREPEAVALWNKKTPEPDLRSEISNLKSEI